MKTHRLIPLPRIAPLPAIPAAGLALALLAFPASVLGQAGDRGGEVQTSRVPAELIPPAPALSAEDSMKTFKVPEGFKVELVASDPLIESPVAVQFGPDGRIWVLEMRGFMPNVNGEGEAAPVGRISVLEDMNRDGRMDKSTVFLDQLVLPRAFMLLRDGLVVAEPPMLWFHRDTNGDGKADEKTQLSDSYAIEANPLLGTRANLEHSANSLTWGLDNWIYSANYATRFRNTGGVWERGATVSRGQWGLSQDDYGRLFFNSNSDQLRVDLVPAEYLSRNPNFPGARGASVQLGPNQVVWPGRINPGVNRGYQPNQLRADFTLATFTATCGPVIYRGNLFPADFRGNAFVAEPAANLIRRNVLTEKDGVITAENPYEQSEFLTSTDERFRPVNLYTGPDGALYVVDMYRGILQHRIYVTTYLREQILSRGLENPINQGRIYRIVPTGTTVAPVSAMPNLKDSSSADLVGYLSHANGWWRDTAQRMLVERLDYSTLPALRKLAAEGPSPLGQIHALWTLDGLGRPDQATIVAALKARDPKVRAAAVRVSERLLTTTAAPAMLAAVLPLAKDPDVTVQRQVAFTVGMVPDRVATLTTILQQNPDNVYVRDAVLSSAGGHELEMLELLAQSPTMQSQSGPAADALILLSRAVFLEGNETRINRALDLAARQTGALTWRQFAILEGLAGNLTSVSTNAAAGGRGGGARGGGGGAAAPAAGGRAGGAVAENAAAPAARGGDAAAAPAVAAAGGRAGGGRAGAAGAGRGGRGGGGGGGAPVTRRLSAEPAAFTVLRQQQNEAAAPKIAAVDAVLLWPGKPGAPEMAVVTPLNTEQERLFRMGREIYTTTCGACHQPDGKGRDGISPPLANSEWATGPESQLIRIVLHGMRGPVTAAGVNFTGEMPPMGALDDTQLASILTYIRREWGHTANPVAPAQVAAVRNETAGRAGAWTAAELSSLP